MLETPKTAPAAESQSTEPGSGEVGSKPGEQRKKPALPREIGGRDGPEPTRFGDWEKDGRCIDF
jgi:hypothetical protein